MANHNEASNGDLSNFFNNPTSITLSPGNNVISGSTVGGGNPPGDRDYFTFEVPVGSTVSAIFLQSYSGATNSYFAVIGGNSFPDPDAATPPDASTFVVSKLIDNAADSEVGEDLLASTVGTAAGPAGPGQLGPGVYSVWYQETGANTTYEFNVVLDTPPAPGQIQFGSSDIEVNEAAGTIDITLTRTGGSDGAVSIQLNSTGGTAQNSVDYNVATPLTVSFADGQTEQVVSVAIVNDALVEGNETAIFALTNPTGGASLGTVATSTLTIVDDDQAGVLRGTNGPDTLTGGPGDDRITGRGGNDRLGGGSGDDRLSGNSEDDRLVGGSGDDWLQGGNGNDRMAGGSGDDFLNGGQGADTLTGGAGRDTFVLKRRHGSDLIRDFQIDEDSLDLRGNLRFGQLTITRNGNQAVISVGGDQLAVLRGVRASQLTAEQFT
ncbi:MAG: hypothetical protein Kow00121_52930 [Elainellaceae cyanobacterium]